MARIQATNTDWSAGTELTEAETWQVVEGKAWITVEASPGDDDGILLHGERGVQIASGKTVKYKLATGYGFADIRREAVS